MKRALLAQNLLAPRMAILILIAALGCMTLLLSGCAGLALSPPATPAVRLTASAGTIQAGQSVTLSWTSTSSTSAQLAPNIGNVPANGSMTVSPTQTTTYVITVTGPGGTSNAQVTVTVQAAPVPAAPTVTISANPTSIKSGQSTVLTVAATGATQVAVTDNIDKNSFTLPPAGGMQTVSPSGNITYTATATGANGQAATATLMVTVTPAGTVMDVQHVLFLLQENRSFDTYFGLLNPFRIANGFSVGDDGKTYLVDGIDDKLNKISNQDDEGQSFSPFKFTTSCVDDMSSAWLESGGDVNRFDFLVNRPILMDGFVHTAEGIAKSKSGSGTFTDLQGKRAMGYYDQDFLNYYYFMASQFALSDRWFSPVASKSTPNRIATMTGGTTQGLVRDPQLDDGLGQLAITTIFEELENAGVTWRVYYSVTDDQCLADNDGECNANAPNKFPATTFLDFPFANRFLFKHQSGTACPPPTQSSKQAVGDPADSFCIDTAHVAPLSRLFTDMTNNTLPSYAFIEAGFGVNDEHPGSGQSILNGQSEVAKLMNAFMASPAWSSSVFFMGYDEGGGPFDHVPPVPGHTNDNTDASLNISTDIKSIAVAPDGFNPCLSNGGAHCDLKSDDPGANSGDAAAQQGFAYQLGFRIPNMVVSPFSRRHFVAHTPMDHTAVVKFVESRFIGPSAHLTNRDAAQPDLLEFFDFNNIPWAKPPTPPAPVTPQSLGSNPCHPDNMGP